MGRILAEDGLPIGYDNLGVEWLIDSDESIADAEICEDQNSDTCISISVFNIDKTTATEIVLSDKDLRRIIRVMKNY